MAGNDNAGLQLTATNAFGHSYQGSQLQSAKFGPNGLDSNLQTPVKKMVGEKEHSKPGANFSSKEGMSSHNLFNRDSTTGCVLDESDDVRTERIEMLRKSIGRGGNRSGIFSDKNQKTFNFDASSDFISGHCGDQNFAMAYYTKNSKLIEDFFVIGIDKEDVDCMQSALP